jgi:hypothetical protein
MAGTGSSATERGLRKSRKSIIKIMDPIGSPGDEEMRERQRGGYSNSDSYHRPDSDINPGMCGISYESAGESRSETASTYNVNAKDLNVGDNGLDVAMAKASLNDTLTKEGCVWCSMYTQPFHMLSLISHLGHLSSQQNNAD